MKANEISLLKSTMASLDSETVILVSYLYHVDKNNKDSSEYRYEARVMKKTDLENEIKDLYSEAKRLLPYYYPTVKNYVLLMDKDTNNGKASAWLNMKLKKLMSYEEFLNYLDGIKKRRTPYLKNKVVNNPHAKFPTEGYVVEGTNETVSLKDKEKLISLCGKNMSLVKYPKRYQQKII